MLKSILKDQKKNTMIYSKSINFIKFCILFFLPFAFSFPSPPSSSPSSPISIHSSPATDEQYRSARVMPILVHNHHLQELREHSKEGNRLAIDALQKGLKKSYNLGKKAIQKTIKCEFGQACKLIQQSFKSSNAGLAGCCNVSIYSHSNSIKHFTKAHFSNHPNQTRDEFYKKKFIIEQNRQNKYDQFGSQNESIGHNN